MIQSSCLKVGLRLQLVVVVVVPDEGPKTGSIQSFKHYSEVIYITKLTHTNARGQGKKKLIRTKKRTHPNAQHGCALILGALTLISPLPPALCCHCFPIPVTIMMSATSP